MFPLSLPFPPLMLTKGVISSPSAKMFMMQNLWVESGCEPRKRRREEERLSQSNYVNTPIKEQGCREKARGRKAGGLDVDGGLEALGQLRARELECVVEATRNKI